MGYFAAATILSVCSRLLFHLFIFQEFGLYITIRDLVTCARSVVLYSCGDTQLGSCRAVILLAAVVKLCHQEDP
jgi:hypothetical protein